MKRSGFFDCLTLDQAQQPAVEFEQPGDQSTELDAAAEVTTFVDRPAPSAFEITRPAARPSSNSYSGSNRNTPLAEAAGIYSSGQR
ncbi:hypothetical protein RVS57_001296 [Pseudomonas aeruginosa]|uniref:hypothetical protein n=1 Tax=Pseudomonas TaxID=286 RepID=UPI00053D93E7|nr:MULTISPECIES: hypothetical protein [Pseudomonas]EKU5528162.1 hypothetical protein [Pseudomonas aeruginosa]EKU5533450.1 hypothetical protein [Pseudomonas aeruginosa]EKU5976918.1 hypothetical protein [Pseudomonas aeruginosa]EKW5989797.1 hypothetical protein [Pseudomonas aeruginosa]ELK4727036.1 hypothetical protein [Pseudomonas aeruginosa]